MSMKTCPICGKNHMKRSPYCSTKCGQRAWQKKNYKPVPYIWRTCAYPGCKKGKYLFNWNEIPGKDSELFIDYLSKTLKLTWLKGAEIKKRKDTITVINGVNLIKIKFDEKENNNGEDKKPKKFLSNRTHARCCGKSCGVMLYNLKHPKETKKWMETYVKKKAEAIKKEIPNLI